MSLMPTNLTPPPSSSHVVYIPCLSNPRVERPPSSQVAATPKPSDRPTRKNESPIRETTSDDEIDVNKDNAPIINEDIHMQGSLDTTNLEQPYVDTQTSLTAGNTLLVARGDHWAKIVEQRAIKNRVQYIHCR
jgi:hypothetical protein